MTRFTLSLLLIALLAGCAASPAELSLVETKSAVQLLRNSTAALVPDDALLSVVKSVDASEPCDAGDPIRRWRSSVILNISAQRAGEVRGFFDDLVARYVDDGWKRGNVGDREAVLSTPDSVATIDVLMTEDADHDGDGASITVLVIGPCVTTDGQDSDEVTGLDGSTN